AMNGKELDAGIVFHPVETTQAVNFRGGDIGNLRFINIERSESRGGRQGAAKVREGIDQRVGRRQRRGANNFLAREADGSGEAEPEFGMVVGAALLVDEIFEQQLARFEVVAV